MSRAIEVFNRIREDIKKTPALELCMSTSERNAFKALSESLENAISVAPFTYKKGKMPASKAKQRLILNRDFISDTTARITEFLNNSIMFCTAKKAVAARMSKTVRPGKVSVLLALGKTTAFKSPLKSKPVIKAIG